MTLSPYDYFLRDCRVSPFLPKAWKWFCQTFLPWENSSASRCFPNVPSDDCKECLGLSELHPLKNSQHHLRSNRLHQQFRPAFPLCQAHFRTFLKDVQELQPFRLGLIRNASKRQAQRYQFHFEAFLYKNFMLLVTAPFIVDRDPVMGLVLRHSRVDASHQVWLELHPQVTIINEKWIGRSIGNRLLIANHQALHSRDNFNFETAGMGYVFKDGHNQQYCNVGFPMLVQHECVHHNVVFNAHGTGFQLEGDSFTDGDRVRASYIFSLDPCGCQTCTEQCSCIRCHEHRKEKKWIR